MALPLANELSVDTGARKGKRDGKLCRLDRLWRPAKFWRLLELLRLDILCRLLKPASVANCGFNFNCSYTSLATSGVIIPPFRVYNNGRLC